MVFSEEKRKVKELITEIIQDLIRSKMFSDFAAHGQVFKIKRFYIYYVHAVLAC